MRVVIVTGTQPHHKNLCAVITREFNVVGIIHPLQTPSRSLARVSRFLRQANVHGWQLTTLHSIGKLASCCRALSDRVDQTSVMPIEFSEGVADYERIPLSLIHFDCNIRDPRSHDLLRSLRPDVTLCLGGPIYPKPFIDASPLTLNFHSGISPIYNGTASIQFAFANGHPHLCGGTLMMMSVKVDGGGILGHYLPAIRAGDSPDSLFRKTVSGAALMYTLILEYLQTGKGTIEYIPQPQPLFYTSAFQLGWYHNAMITQNLRLDIAGRFQRMESLVEYWREPSMIAAKTVFQSTVDNLLWNVG